MTLKCVECPLRLVSSVAILLLLQLNVNMLLVSLKISVRCLHITKQPESDNQIQKYQILPVFFPLGTVCVCVCRVCVFL